jgi:hypothetical protein
MSWFCNVNRLDGAARVPGMPGRKRRIQEMLQLRQLKLPRALRQAILRVDYDHISESHLLH